MVFEPGSVLMVDRAQYPLRTDLEFPKSLPIETSGDVRPIPAGRHPFIVPFRVSPFPSFRILMHGKVSHLTHSGLWDWAPENPAVIHSGPGQPSR